MGEVAMGEVKLSNRIRQNSEAAPWVVDAVKLLEAERDALRADAARWRAFKPMVRTFSLDMGGQHSYCTTGEFGRIRGPNIDAAMDAYILRLNATPKENTNG